MSNVPKSNCLFVGGCADGSWRMVEDDRDWFEVYEKPPPPTYNDFVSATATVEVRTQIYVRVPFAVENRRYDLFVPRGCDADWAIQTLMQGYHRVVTPDG